MDDTSHSILDTLRTVEFRLGLKGYNVDEVDEYLEKAAVEAEQVQERLRTSNERLRHATERIAQLEVELQRSPAERTVAIQPSAPEASPAPAGPPSQGYGVTEETLQRTLVLAQKFVEQTKRESEVEAAQVVSQAEERARALLGQAEERARQLTTETEERLHAEVARLEETRSRLTSDVEDMSRHLEEQRTRIRASLADALRWVDERMQAPARSTPDRGGEGGAAVRRASPAEDAGSAGRGEPARLGGTPGSEDRGGPGGPSPIGVGTGARRPQVASSSGAPARQPATVPAHPSSTPTGPDRTQAPVGARLGLLGGGLFESGRDDKHGFEGDRLGE